MKTIGLIGGMSYESTLSYYEIINKLTNEKLGKLHSAKIVLTSVDFEEIEECQRKNDWQKASEILTQHALLLQKSGVDFILICTNTMHKCYENIQKNIQIPILHIAKAMLLELQEQNIDKVLLLGTKYTMQEDFYKQLLINSKIEVFIPKNDDILKLNDIIFNELCKGIINEKSKRYLCDLIAQFSEVQGVILGCTELGLIIKENSKKLFDSAYIHAKMATLKALENE
ncbi:aspartate/glutamate racemase family protein [Campylobacter lari]|uniref:aspartate/glutamate racemase family protein n=1 Tax=unclassified Campylobacter TaxID=2593542 RepID=UPI0012774D3E|nr:MULTISPECIES: aspartate/glutamate racemase family protein [unclassified Campylobacter]EAK0441454.1 aspartate/glutamate racemase family protein [Campylobacter lari]EAK9882655.1 aspartate/glutamate racemase family protein [Campylobacter lari]EGK8092317.1 aspartate/glutamate racemase family protein [Campylobacter lari]MCV3425049.1 aspartate/glutamate racemase family protein [Campylobacter sp. IFREMER_LSEM_CL1085]MCV3553037.1 aspartate/glutamate racemase family protein [Campylobacter sp. CNRCH_